MKFSGSFSALLVVLPLLLQAAALPNGRRGGFGGFGQGSRFGFGANNNQNANKNNNNNAAGAKNNGGSAAAQATTSAAAAAQTTSAASSSQNGNNNLAAQGGSNTANEQTSLTLDPSLIGPNLALNGLNGTGSEAGQAPSLTSTNNFINFCLGKTLTNGLQVKGGSCNPVPMGDMPANTAQPAAKFVSPVNGQNLGENTSFTVQMAISNLDTGFFVNPNTNYFGAPQQLVNGVIQGHSHIVIQAIPSFTSTQVVDPASFVFFQGLNSAAQNGVLTATVSAGLPAGTYKVSSINTAANHQPALGPVAQHGSFDDAVYFSVGGSGDSPFGAASGAAAAGGAANGGANNAAAGAANGGANSAATNTAAAANNGANNAGAAAATAAAAKNTAAAANNGAKNTGAANNGAKNAGAANNGAKNTGAANKQGQQGQQGKGRRSFNIARQE